eukprot:6187619-Amphidinium_carterae.1
MDSTLEPLYTPRFVLSSYCACPLLPPKWCHSKCWGWATLWCEDVLSSCVSSPGSLKRQDIPMRSAGLLSLCDMLSKSLQAAAFVLNVY